MSINEWCSLNSTTLGWYPGRYKDEQNKAPGLQVSYVSRGLTMIRSRLECIFRLKTLSWCPFWRVKEVTCFVQEHISCPWNIPLS